MRPAPRRVLWLLPLALASVARAEEPSPDVPGGPAVVVGRLVHETRPGAVADLGVLLYALAPDGRSGLRQGRTDAQGRFRFEGVSNAPEIVYLVGARPGEIPFGTRFQFGRGEHEHRVELALSDPVTETTRATLHAVDVRVDRGCTHLRVGHRYEIRNPGKQVVFVPTEQRGGATPILELEIPAEASGFESLLGREGLELDRRRVRFWGPLYPGTQEIQFGYGLPLDAASFELGFPRGSREIRVLAPTGLLTLSGAGLRPDPELRLGGQRYAVQHADAVAPGDSLGLAVALAAELRSPLQTPRAELWLELDDTALEVDERLEVAVEGHAGLEESPAAPLLCMALPPEAEALRFSPELLAAGPRRDPSGALAIHGPLPGGVSQLAVSYRLRASSSGARLQQRFDRELPLLTVLVADTGVVADTTRLHRRRAVRSADRMYLHLEGFAVEPQETLELGLRRTAPRGEAGPWASAGFALLAGVAAFAFLLGPLRAAPREPTEATEPEPDAMSLERLALVRSLEDLDDDLETGKLSPEDHAVMRAALRARAAALLLRSPVADAAPPAPLACGECGTAARQGDHFCSQCGAKLGVRSS